MGCWRGTCVITQLSVGYDEPCRIVFLRKSILRTRRSEGGGFCYPTDLWTPASLPIPARYNSYGAVEGEDPEDWRVQHFLGWLQEALVEQEALPSAYRNAIKRENMKSLKDVTSEIHDQPHRVGVADFFAKTVWVSLSGNSEERGEGSWGEFQPDPLGFCLIREDVFQGLLKSPIEHWNGKKTIADYHQEAEEWLQAVIKVLSETNEEMVSVLLRFRSYYDLDRSNIWRDGEGLGTPLASIQESFVGEIGAAIREGTLDAYLGTLRPKLRDIVEYRWVADQFGSLRKFWAPQSGAGSQDEGITAHRALLAITKQALSNMEAFQ